MLQEPCCTRGASWRRRTRVGSWAPPARRSGRTASGEPSASAALHPMHSYYDWSVRLAGATGRPILRTICALTTALKQQDNPKSTHTTLNCWALPPPDKIVLGNLLRVLGVGSHLSFIQTGCGVPQVPERARAGDAGAPAGAAGGRAGGAGRRAGHQVDAHPAPDRLRGRPQGTAPA